MLRRTLPRRALVSASANRSSSQFRTVGLNPSSSPFSSHRSGGGRSNSGGGGAASSAGAEEEESYLSPEDTAALQAAATQLMRFKIARPEHFYFTMTPAGADGSSSASQNYVEQQQLHQQSHHHHGSSRGGSRDSNSGNNGSSSGAPSSPGNNICRLCGEFVSDSQIKFHLFGAGTRGPSSHMGREIVLDTLVYYGKAGFDPALVCRSFPLTLLSCANIPRIPSLLPQRRRRPDSSDGGGDGSNIDALDLDARAERVVTLLRGLQAMGVLDIAVSPHSEPGRTPEQLRAAVRRRSAFERFETIGDNSWGSNLSSRLLLLFSDKRWSNCNMHHSFNAARDLAETNSNLERMFDMLQLQSLLPPASRAVVTEGKIKADIVESVIGELNAVIYAHESTLRGPEEYTEPNDEHLARLCALVRHVQSEIFDLTILFMLQSLSDNSVPLARELVQQSLFLPPPPGSLAASALTSSGVTPSAIVSAMRPPLDPGSTVRTRRPHFHANFVPTFHLPPRLRLSGAGSIADRGKSGGAARSDDDELSATTALGQLLRSLRPSTAAADFARLAPQHLQQRLRELGGPAAVNGMRGKYAHTAHWHSLLNCMRASNPDEQHVETTAPRLQEHPSVAPAECGAQPSTPGEPPLLSEPHGAESALGAGAGGGASATFSGAHQGTMWRKRISVAELVALVLPRPEADGDGGRKPAFRQHCPFRQLARHPPHAYNPYGIAPAEWMARWQRTARSDPASSPSQLLARDIFHEDVVDSVDVVLAQFEATSGGGGGNAADTAKTPAVPSEPAAVELGVALEELLPPLGAGSDDEVDELPDVSQIAVARRELRELVHPFAQGVTVGSDGASFLALSSSIQAVATAAATAALDGVDIDLMKRRNSLLRGEKVR